MLVLWWLVAAGFVVLVVAVAWPRRDGDGGAPRLDVRPTPPFRSISVAGPIHVEIVVGETPRVELEGGERRLRDVYVGVRGETLELRPSWRWRMDALRWPGGAIRARLQVPELGSVVVVAGAQARVGGIPGGRVSLTALCRGRIDAEGCCERLMLVALGSAQIRAAETRARQVDVWASVGGHVELRAGHVLDLNVAFGSNVSVRGAPSLERRSVLLSQVHNEPVGDDEPATVPMRP